MARGNSGLYVNPGGKEDVEAVVIVPDNGGENTSVDGQLVKLHRLPLTATEPE